jgi:hypothetical protein
VSAPAVCTVVAKNRLSLARVLARSFAAHHQAIPFFVLLADEVDGAFDAATEPFELIPFAGLEVPDADAFRFHYEPQALSYASTPYLLSHLLGRGFERVLFIKQESLVVGHLDRAFDALHRHAIVLTPHLLTPFPGAAGIAREQVILKSGAYNVGLLGVSDRPDARAFLHWWRERTFAHCRHDIGGGMHWEQRWLDLVPGFFDDVHILKDPGSNVGHWNLPERVVRVDGDQVLVDGGPGGLIRFSGYDPDRPGQVTRYFDRLTPDALGAAWQLWERYQRELVAAGWENTRAWPYAWATFTNGVPIPDTARQLYRDLDPDARVALGDPFAADRPGGFVEWLNAEPPITRYWQWIHRMRTDLIAAFPDPVGADREAYLTWILEHGRLELSIPDAFVPRGGA